MDRRSFFTASGFALLAGAAAAQTPATAPPSAPPPLGPPTPPDRVIPIWPGRPPGGESHRPRATPVEPSAIIRDIDVPILNLYRPANPDGSALIICPGGGYAVLSATLEASMPARRFNQDGVTVFVLHYRLPGEGWADTPNVPLQDVQRAIRLLRARAAEFGIDPARIGVMGFSAGGHLAATLANRFNEVVYAPVDGADRLSAKPSYAALIYPVITMRAPLTYSRGVPFFLGPDPSPTLVDSRSNELLVTAETSPCFIAHGLDDQLVPVENSLLMISALREKRVPCEAHLFQEGRHGFGLGITGQPNQAWPDLFIKWMRRHERLSAIGASPRA